MTGIHLPPEMQQQLQAAQQQQQVQQAIMYMRMQLGVQLLSGHVAGGGDVTDEDIDNAFALAERCMERGGLIQRRARPDPAG